MKQPQRDSKPWIIAKRDWWNIVVCVAIIPIMVAGAWSVVFIQLLMQLKVMGYKIRQSW